MIVHKRQHGLRHHRKYILGQGIGFSDVVSFVNNNKDSLSNIAQLTSEIANAGIQTAKLVNEIKSGKRSGKGHGKRKCDGWETKLKEIENKFGSGFKII